MPGLTGFVPEVYATQTRFRMDAFGFLLMHHPPQSNWKALDILCEEIVNNVCGAPEKAKVVEQKWCMAMSNVSTMGAKACKVGASDGPTSSPHVHPILPAGIVGPGLSPHGIIHKVPDPVHPPLAPGSRSGSASGSSSS